MPPEQVTPAAGAVARQGGRASLAARASRTRTAALLLPALAAVAVSFAGIGSHSLWTPDEPRDAAIGKAMWVSGELAMPRLDGQPFLEKPPLSWWLQTAAYQAFGASDRVARVPSAACAALTLLVVFWLARRLGGGTRAGWLAAGALAATAEWSEDMRRAIVDPPLVLMVALSCAAFAVLVTGGSAESGAAADGDGERAPDPHTDPGAGGDAAHGHRLAQVGSDRPAAPARASVHREIWAARLVIVLAVPLAFLAKGMVGLALALLPVACLVIAAVPAVPVRLVPGDGPRWRATLRLLAPIAWIGVPVFAAMALPWAAALVHEGGWGALRECLVGNTLGRLFPTDSGRVYGHRMPLWYYLPQGALALLPWTLALPAVLRKERPADGGQAGGRSTDAAARGRALLVGTFFAGVLLLSSAASKRSVYLVPLLPALAVPLGLWLDGLGRGERAARRAWDRPTALGLLALAALLPVALWAVALVAARRSAFGSMPLAPLHAQLITGRIAMAGIVALGGAAALLHRWMRHLRAGTMPGGAWLVVPWLAVALVYQTAIKAVIDPLKDPHDLTAAIARLDPGAGPVAAYRPSETTLGIIGFDLGRRVQALATPAEVEAYFAARPEGRVVFSLGAFNHLPAPLRARLRLLYDETAAKASPFGIAGAVIPGSPSRAPRAAESRASLQRAAAGGQADP